LSFYESLYNNSPVLLQNLLISAYGYGWKRRRFGGVFPFTYAAAKERESFTRAQWLDYQNKELRKILLHTAEQVPFYKEKFKQAGITIQQLKAFTVEDLFSLPILTKEELRQFGTTTLLSNIRERNGQFFSSSGSTGTPTQILLSHAMHQRWFGIYEARVRNWAGVSSFIPRGMIGGRRIIADAANKSPFYRYNFFEKQVYFSAYHISQRNALNYLEGIKRHGVEYMTGYAVSNYLLAQLFKEVNADVPDLKAVVTSSEKLTPAMRQVFTDVYGCKTFDGWGSVESCGLVTECEWGSLHVNEDAGIIEILDDELKPVPAGEQGTVYCTGLLNYDQPLIRYKIGDTMIPSDRVCGCGRQMPVIEEIMGRIEDEILGKDGRKMVRFHSVFNGLKTVKQAQVIQENPDDIVVKIVPAGKLGNDEQKIIQGRIISQLGRVNVLIEEVDKIPLTNNGKFKAVVSKLVQG
jgi:phenylacetate-CoA ligase